MPGRHNSLIYLHKGGTKSMSTTPTATDAKGEVSSTYVRSQSHSVQSHSTQSHSLNTESSDKGKRAFAQNFASCCLSQQKTPRISSSRVLSSKIQVTVAVSLSAADSHLALTTSSFGKTGSCPMCSIFFQNCPVLGFSTAGVLCRGVKACA
jgi:hypothetical protein